MLWVSAYHIYIPLKTDQTFARIFKSKSLQLISKGQVVVGLFGATSAFYYVRKLESYKSVVFGVDYSCNDSLLSIVSDIKISNEAWLVVLASHKSYNPFWPTISGRITCRHAYTIAPDF